MAVPKAEAYDLAKEGRKLAHDNSEFMIAVFRNFQKRDWAEVAGRQIPIPKDLGYHNQGYMAAAPVYGSSSLDENPTWFPERWTEVRPWDWYMGEEEITLEDKDYPVGGTTPAGEKAWPQMQACTGVPLYDGQPVEVGPRARLVQFKNYDEKGAIGLQIARQMEYEETCYGIMEACDALDTSASELPDEIPAGRRKPWRAASVAPLGLEQIKVQF